MSIKLFGHRCLVERTKPAESKEFNILIPDSAKERDTHRFGRVLFVGDGKTPNGVLPSLVSTGDVVMFQINQVMENTQHYVYQGKTCMNMLQGEVIGKLVNVNAPVSFDNFQPVGNYVVLKHFQIGTPSGGIFIPDNVARNSAPDFIYFRVVKKGPAASKDFSVGDEVVVNLGRLTPFFFTKRTEKGITSDEYCYTTDDWLDGVVEGIDHR